MKLIIVIALIGLTVSQTAWVSPTTQLAKAYQTAAAKSATTAAANLKTAAAALKAAKDARKLAQVPTTKWSDFTAAMAMVGTKMTALGVQDTALAVLAKGWTDATAAQAKATVDNQCQVMTAAAHLKWKTAAASFVTATGAYKNAETAFVDPVATTWNTAAVALKKSFTDMEAYINTNKVVTVLSGSSFKDGSSNNAKNYGMWVLSGAPGTGVANSWSKMSCPYDKSAICLDCAGAFGAANGATTAFKKTFALKQTGCNWQQLNSFAQMLDKHYTNVINVNTAKGYWGAVDYVQTNYVAKATVGITATTAIYQGLLDGYKAKVSTYMAQVDLLAALLLKMQQTQGVAMYNAGLLKAAAAAVKVAADLVTSGASTDLGTATGALTTLGSDAATAAGKVTAQWTVCNNTAGAAMKAMGMTRGAVGALGTANAALMGALKAQGIAHELYTSSQASDSWATTAQTGYQTLAALSKTDYDAVVAMKKASGSSMIQFSLLTFVILLAYRKF